jgi:hypothetical protein
MGPLATQSRWDVRTGHKGSIRPACRSGGDQESPPQAAPAGKTLASLAVDWHQATGNKRHRVRRKDAPSDVSYLRVRAGPGLTGRELSQSHRPARRAGHLRRAVHPFGELLDLRNPSGVPYLFVLVLLAQLGSTESRKREAGARK